MNQTLPTCARCSTPFWPNAKLPSNPANHFCLSCTPPRESDVALSSDPSFESVATPQIEIIRTVPKPTSGDRVLIQPRELPGQRAQNPFNSNPIPSPSPPQTLSFNCPACMTGLSVARDLAIAGTTVACSHCASMIIPPRIAPAAAARPVLKANWRPEH